MTEHKFQKHVLYNYTVGILKFTPKQGLVLGSVFRAWYRRDSASTTSFCTAYLNQSSLTGLAKLANNHLERDQQEQAQAQAQSSEL